jgi:hypothetical protein
MNIPWHFAKADDTRKLLEKIDYIKKEVHLHNTDFVGKMRLESSTSSWDLDLAKRENLIAFCSTS